MNLQTIKIKDFVKKLKINDENIETRQECFEKFIKDGFPSKTLEEWRFMDLNQIISQKLPNLRFFNNQVLIKSDYLKTLNSFNLKVKDFNHIIYVNGFIKEIKFKNEDINKIKCIRKKNKFQIKQQSSLENLNHALNFDYIKISVKDNYIFKEPLIIINIIEDKIINTNLNQCIDITMGKNSNLSIVDINLSNSRDNFINIKKNYELNDGSILKNYVLDPFENHNINYSNTNIDLQKNSISENFVYSYGSIFSKNEISCNLNSQYSSAFVNGVVDVNKEKKHEIRTKINHLSEDTKSYQLIKCALNDKSKAVYQGKIFVDSKAQKTDGYQLSKAVLLNKETEFNGKPELEIYADDVKCSHGSSSGNLDENKIFYLMTRGLSKNEAKKILLDGYFLEVIEKITDDKIKLMIKNLMNIK